MISYESSKWYVKAWRSRWYLYAVLLYLKEFLKIELIIDFILSGLLLGDDLIEDEEEEKIRKSWKDIIRHVELSKMYKFTQK